ncbi:MAG TPA: ATP-binding protein, partial [Clostridia bacterium]|nr:ATP-binding protein [Clostridia bacterium]
ALVRQFEFSIWRVGGAAALVGAASLASVLFIQGLWRARLFECLEQQERDCESQTIQLEAQLADARRARELAQSAQADLEAQVAALASAKASLQEALDKRTRAEKALTQKRQELESSKSVLELHVQARTQELQKLQRLYEMILNSAGEGICGLDMEGKTTFVNPTVAKITGLKLEELIGRKETEVFRIQGFDGKAPSESTACEGLFHRCDGSSVPVEFVRTPINEDGRAVGAVLVFKDITERKRVEETLSQKAAELARSNAELEQFAFVASHDLQEPLRKIQAFGDRLKGKCEGILPAEALDYLERMHSASARMRNLINDLLAFSRVIRSSEPFIAVDIGKVVREVLGDLEVRIEKSGAVVEFGSLATIEADPMQMRQLFQNLIGNALKFQPAGGKPVVRIASRAFNAPSGKEFCEITVQDNGIGFDEKYLDRIFAVFQRLHGRAEYEGTGVGLAVCRRIVDRHGGSISARSVPGKGATFSVMLPLSQIPAEEAA